MLFIHEKHQQIQSLFHINVLFVWSIRGIVASSGEMIIYSAVIFEDGWGQEIINFELRGWECWKMTFNKPLLEFVLSVLISVAVFVL